MTNEFQIVQNSQRQSATRCAKLRLAAQNMLIEGKKGKGVRLYIYEDDEPRLDECCKRTGLTYTAALSMIISAGLKALERDEFRITLPLEFRVAKAMPEKPPEKKPR